MSVVNANARIVCANGLMKHAKTIRPNDVIMDVHGYPQRVLKCKNVELDVNDTICKVGVNTFPEPLIVPVHSNLMTLHNSWVPVRSIATTPSFHIETEWISTNRWALADQINIIPNDHTILSKMISNSFELGFVVGSFIASGSVSTPGTEITFKFDTSMRHRTLLDTCIKNLDPSARLTVIKYRDFKTLRVQSILLESILSGLFHRNLDKIFDEWICKDREYISGIYMGLSELSMTHRANMDVYNLISWCKHYLDPDSFKPTLKYLHMIENEDDHDFIEITTPSTGLIANHICIS